MSAQATRSAFNAEYPLHTIPVTADVFGVDRSTIYRWLDSGLLESVRIAGVRRVKTDSILRAIQQGEAA